MSPGAQGCCAKRKQASPSVDEDTAIDLPSTSQATAYQVVLKHCLPPAPTALQACNYAGPLGERPSIPAATPRLLCSYRYEAPTRPATSRRAALAAQKLSLPW